MDLPKIAWVCGKNSMPNANEFSEYLKDFYNVFHDDEHYWWELDKPTELNLSRYDAVLTRPKWRGNLSICKLTTPAVLKYSDKFQVATLSVSDSKISKAIKDSCNIIISKHGNIDSTAELAVYMAIDLRRRLNFHAMNVARGGWSGGDITKDSFGLKGSKWAIIGTGNLGSRILARLPGMGVESVKAYYRIKDRDSKCKAIAFVEKAFPNPEKRFPDLDDDTLIYKTVIKGNPGYDTNGKPISDKLDVPIEVSDDLGYVIKDSDVVILALPYKEPDSEGRHGTAGFIKMSTMNNLKEHAVFINVARAEIINKDVYEAFFPRDEDSGEYYFAIRDGRGFASDVLQEDIECQDLDNSKEDDDFQTYRLRRVHKKLMLMPEMSKEDEWKKLCWPGAEQGGAELSYPRLLLTPHIGSGTAESNQAVAREVLERLLAHFGIREKYEVFHRHYDYGQYVPGSDDVLVLNGDEALLVKDLESDDKFNENLLSQWVSRLAMGILPIYTGGGQIRTRKTENISEEECNEYPCRWNLGERLNIEQPSSNNDEDTTANGTRVVTVFSPKKLLVSIDKKIVNELSAYTYCGSPIALSDWIRYTLWIFHSVFVWFGKDWTLEKWIEGSWGEIDLSLSDYSKSRAPIR